MGGRTLALPIFDKAVRADPEAAYGPEGLALGTIIGTAGQIKTVGTGDGWWPVLAICHPQKRWLAWFTGGSPGWELADAVPLRSRRCEPMKTTCAPAPKPPTAPCSDWSWWSRLAAPATSRRSEEHTSELQSLMRISYAVFCLKKKKNKTTIVAPAH